MGWVVSALGSRPHGGEWVGGPSPALPKLKPTFSFLPFYRDSSRKHDKMRPKIIFGGRVYFSMVCLHQTVRRREAVKDLSQMAGLEKHKSNVNRWKYKCLVSLNFFLKNISSFLFLRQSKGKMHSRKEAGRRREQAGASEKLVQKTCSPLGVSASPGGCQN